MKNLTPDMNNKMWYFLTAYGHALHTKNYNACAKIIYNMNELLPKKYQLSLNS